MSKSFYKIVIMNAFLVLFCFPAQSQVDVTQENQIASRSPRIMDPERPGYFQLGVGPSLAIGLDTDQVLYNLNASYSYNLSERFAGKAFGDLNLGTSSDAARFAILGLGADYYFQEVIARYGIPYASLNVGYGFVRDNNNLTQEAPTVGTGVGFKFSTESLNLDISAHYTILTDEISGKTPSVTGIRAAMNF